MVRWRRPSTVATRKGYFPWDSPRIMDSPVRVEFFGDEVDAMGVFDPATQRRTENLKSAVLLPAAEVLPQLAPGGLQGLSQKIGKLAAKALENGHKELHTAACAPTGGRGRRRCGR